MAKKQKDHVTYILQIIHKRGINHLVDYRRALYDGNADIAATEDTIAEELAEVYALATGRRARDVSQQWMAEAKAELERIDNSLRLFAEAVRVN